MCREAKAKLCRLTADLHPCGPTGTAGLCARQPFPNPFCCTTGSCQSSLCPRPRLPPSNRVYTPCWICSACHLQRQCQGPAKTPQIQLSLLPPASALGQGVLFQHSSQRDCSLQIQLSAESHFLRLDMQVVEKAIFCLCQIFKHPKAERKAYMTSKADCIAQIKEGIYWKAAVMSTMYFQGKNIHLAITHPHQHCLSYPGISFLSQLKDELHSRNMKEETAINPKPDTRARTTLLVSPAQHRSCRRRCIRGQGFAMNFRWHHEHWWGGRGFLPPAQPISYSFP